MLDLGLDLMHDEDVVRVQEEPALEIAMPQAFVQPPLTVLQRGKLPAAEALVAQIFRRHQANPDDSLGADYQELVTEFHPLFQWATASWDYLLSTEGCRFVPRHGEVKWGARGDYRALTYKDYSRIVHAVFRGCVLEFAQRPSVSTLSEWLRERFWPLIREAYQRLEQPPDPRQRTLTPYSYLRCVPYEFLNDFHQDLVYTTAQRLPAREWDAINAYFLHFFTEAASAQAMGCSVEELLTLLRQALLKLLIHHRLVYCLLRQIERY